MSILFNKTVLSCIFVTMLSACGGGGGGGGGSGSPANTPAASSSSAAAVTDITASNQNQVANTGITSVNAALSIAGGARSPSSGSVSTLALDASPSLQHSVAEIIDARIRSLVMREGSVFAVAAITSSSTTACTGGGSYVGTEVYASSSTDTVGDTYTVVYTNCIESGLTLNGTVKLELRAFNANRTSFSIRVAYTSLRAASGTTSMVYNGTYDLSTLYATGSTTYGLTDGNISASFVSSGYTGTLGLSGMATTSVVPTSGNITNNPVKLGLTATIAGTSIGMQIEAVAPVVTTSSGTYVSGKIKITGRGSILYVTFLGSGSVKVDLDANGDGTIDSTKTTTITALAAS
ncbi:hypothetical protein VVD49_07210 [Uliginosibacterium sp. H3]|uniref:Lipoprotein n=1 Tax=Uliginosibacterium silvisoli TaxID=3114758 RepID=A0ABU6K140_9RHOO|nr:hypothetical protein [Uliginosibacterium sp. H3]